MLSFKEMFPNHETFESEDGCLFLVKINGIWLYDEFQSDAIMLSAYPYIKDSPADVQARVFKNLEPYLEPDGNGAYRPNKDGRFLLEKLREDEAFRNT